MADPIENIELQPIDHKEQDPIVSFKNQLDDVLKKEVEKLEKQADQKNCGGLYERNLADFSKTLCSLLEKYRACVRPSQQEQKAVMKWIFKLADVALQAFPFPKQDPLNHINNPIKSADSRYKQIFNENMCLFLLTAIELNIEPVKKLISTKSRIKKALKEYLLVKRQGPYTVRLSQDCVEAAKVAFILTRYAPTIREKFGDVYIKNFLANLLQMKPTVSYLADVLMTRSGLGRFFGLPPQTPKDLLNKQKTDPGNQYDEKTELNVVEADPLAELEKINQSVTPQLS